MQIEIGSGELIDKITILQIKAVRMSNAAQLKNVHYELEMLEAVRDKYIAASVSSGEAFARAAADLKAVNEALWDIEDDIRRCEAAGDFGDKFIELARAVYKTNDKRAALKKEINLLTGAAVIEEKSYTEFE